MSKVPALTGVVGTLPLPNTTPTPAVGETVKAEDVQMAAQGLLNQDATLEALKLSLAGGTMTGGLTLAGIPGALVLPNGGTITVQPGGVVTVAAGGEILVDGLVRFENATAELRMDAASFANLYGRTRIRGYTDLTDADHTLYDSVTLGNHHIRMLTAPAANRKILLPDPIAWTPSTAVTNGVTVRKNAGNVYLCSQTGVTAPSGGPTTTGAGIVDGSAKWDYQGLAPVEGDWFKITVFVGASTFSVQVGRQSSAQFLAFLGPVPAGDPGPPNTRTASVLARYTASTNRWHAIDFGGRVAYFGDEATDP